MGSSERRAAGSSSAESRRCLVLRTLQPLFAEVLTEEVPIALLKQHLQSAAPQFADAELNAVLEELEHDNYIMYRDSAIHNMQIHS